MRILATAGTGRARASTGALIESPPVALAQAFTYDGCSVHRGSQFILFGLALLPASAEPRLSWPLVFTWLAIIRRFSKESI